MFAGVLPMPRIGLGSDLHRLAPGSGLRIGGVEVPCAFAPVAHSDGDALLHAVTDAILGALGGPDIGELFPDRDPAHRGRDSADFLGEALVRMRAAGLRIGNLDTIVRLQTPRLGPHKEAIRARLAALCACPPDRVAVKAKTGEGLDAIGRSEAFAAEAAVLLEP